MAELVVALLLSMVISGGIWVWLRQTDRAHQRLIDLARRDGM